MVLSACVRLQLYIILCFSLLGKVIGALRKNSSVLPCRHFLSQRVSCLSFQASSLFSSRCCVQFSVLVQTPLDRDCFSSVANKKALQKFLSHSSGVAIDRRYHPITVEGREFLSGATVLQGRAGRGGEVGVAALVGSYGTKKKEGYVWGRRFEFSIFSLWCPSLLLLQTTLNRQSFSKIIYLFQQEFLRHLGKNVLVQSPLLTINTSHYQHVLFSPFSPNLEVGF